MGHPQGGPGRRRPLDGAGSSGGSGMSAPTTTTIEAFKLQPGDKVCIYGNVAVRITDVERLPAFKPAQTVKLRYRCLHFGGHPLDGTMTVPAGQTFPVYDDGSLF